MHLIALTTRDAADRQAALINHYGDQVELFVGETRRAMRRTAVISANTARLLKDASLPVTVIQDDIHLTRIPDDDGPDLEIHRGYLDRSHVCPKAFTVRTETMRNRLVEAFSHFRHACQVLPRILGYSP